MSPLSLDLLLGCALVLITVRLWPAPDQLAVRRTAILAVSVAMLAYWQPLGLVVTLALTAITWLAIAGTRATPANAGTYTTLGVTAVVAALVVAKYTPWLLNMTLGEGTVRTWIVPLGISFTAFRLIGAILDARALKTAVGAGELFFLALFFPTFRSGPIESLRSLRPLAGADAEQRDVAWAFGRILVGVCRKVILADTLFTMVIGPWETEGIAQLRPVQCLVLPFLYGLYIYWDFAGYTDVAIGTGALLGYRVSENFDRPYLSRNVSDFWRRWHITLSEWIRLRLFMKMVGRRSPTWQLNAATVVSMGLCGLWHGAGWNFLAWGLWHGFGLVGVQVFGEAQRRSEALRRVVNLPGATLAATVLTFAYVSAGWAMFFLPLGSAAELFARAARTSPPMMLAVAAAVTALLALYEALGTGRLARLWQATPAVARGAVYALLLFGIILGRAEPAENFIYFAF
jgi:alginate O-acetyltransferase complex protein AlgI